MATTDSEEYLRMLTDYRSHSTYESEYFKTLQQLEADKVHFRWVRSCVGFGTGSGQHEIEFIRRFLPDLRRFIAVDPDRKSLDAFQGNAKNGRLPPEVETTVVEKSIQTWNGTGGERVDAAMLFNVCFHVEPVDRRELIRKLTKCLNPGGLAFVIEATSSETVGIVRLCERLGKRIDSRMCDEIEKDLLSAGYSLLLAREILSTLDLSDAGTYAVKFVQLLLENDASEREIRAAIGDVYRDRAMLDNTRRLAIFKKNFGSDAT